MEPVSPLIWWLSAAAGSAAVLCIRGKYNQAQLRVFVFKPLATVLLLFVALGSGGIRTTYGSLVLVAMVFSLLGDIFLMLPKDRFLQGLLSFLVAHLFLIGAFALEWPGVTWWILGGVLFLALGVYLVLAPYLGRMKLPVTVYISVIGVMVWIGLERWLGTGSISGALAGAGALCFMASDSVLGLNRFRSPFRSADALSLGTYWVSLWLIALSVRPCWL